MMEDVNAANTRPGFIGAAMRVTTEDLAELDEFPLRWRWSREYADFEPGDLGSIRPIHPEKAAVICQEIVSPPFDVSRPEDRIILAEGTEPYVISAWLEDKIPQGVSEVLLVWDQSTAALVPRRLFVERWSDFSYPSSDDLSVMGMVDR